MSEQPKDARLEMRLKAKSGYLAGSASDVSAAQWHAVNAIVDGDVDPHKAIAAPDLYAALDAFQMFYPMGINPDLDDACRAARAALAKARGQA